jgi:glycosyltransferase involved in cell wall biosynthesis
MYFFGGQFVNLAMVNSKWTKAHVEKRWGGKAALVYPPVDVEKFTPPPPPPPSADSDHPQAAGQQPHLRDIAIMSCAQFRPEKEHALQIDILRQLHKTLRERGKQDSDLPCLMIVGGADDSRAVKPSRRHVALTPHCSGISCDDDMVLLDGLRKQACDLVRHPSAHLEPSLLSNLFRRCKALVPCCLSTTTCRLNNSLLANNAR